jgi:hypothetical protein
MSKFIEEGVRTVHQGIDITVIRSADDGYTVVYIDEEEDLLGLRVYVNDFLLEPEDDIED